MDLTVNLFTSFGYFEHDEEHEATLGEMASTIRRGGWFVIDLLNPASVRAGLVPRETVGAGKVTAQVTRSLSPDNRYVCKTIEWSSGRRFFERVRLFEPDEIVAMLERSGLTISASFGEYDGRPLAPGSPRTILIGQST